jgi:hypothetical protein
MTKAAVRAASVVVLDVAPQNANKLLAADDQQLVQALLADRADPPLGRGVGIGRLHGVRITSVPVERHTLSNTLVNLASRSRSRNFRPAA